MKSHSGRESVLVALTWLVALSIGVSVSSLSAQDEEPAPPPPRASDGAKRHQRPKDDSTNEAQKDDKDGKSGGSCPRQYSIEQAISDQAQLHTIAFSGLAFITGEYGADTFIPPGKVCDYFGFQYMRDIDAARKGHNPVFLNRIAGNVLHILNDGQKKIFLDLAEEQAGKMEELARMRLPLIKAFCLELDGNIPEGSSGLDRDAVMKYVGKIFASDAEISLRRAEIFSKISKSLSSEQKEYLDKMKFGDFNTWPELDERDKLHPPKGKDKSRLFNVAYMTFASEFFSWIKGSVEADTYFCPERHGTYFGGFYMKDMPAMGKRDYDISTSVTGDSGKDFLNALSGEQRKYLTEIPDLQRKDIEQIVALRRAISIELRKFLEGAAPSRATLIELARRYGELDGKISWLYTTAFAKIAKSLSTEQRQALLKIRNLDGYKCANYYIYSQAMNDHPSIGDTDGFFSK